MTIEKDRYWTFLIYLDSAPKNWRDILQETGLQIAISPLHDKDITDVGELKKPHYHVILCFNGPTTYSKVCSITESLNSPIPKRILSVIGMYRYFTHKDNPEKYQYNEEDITTLNGFDIEDRTGMTTSQTIAIKRQIQKIINDNKIRYYCDLIDYINDNLSNDFYLVASNNTLFFNTYISSRYKKNSLQNDNYHL